jgi:hypothetical protein
MKLTRLATVVVVLAVAGCFMATAVAIVIRHSPILKSSTHSTGSPQTLAIVGNVSRGLYPGGRPVQINLTIDNPSRYARRLTNVAVSIQAVRAPRSMPGLPCTTADFGVGGYRGSFKAPPGLSTLQHDGVPRARWPTLRMVDRPYNQDGCKGATVELVYRALAGKSGRN